MEGASKYYSVVTDTGNKLMGCRAGGRGEADDHRDRGGGRGWGILPAGSGNDCTEK